jgi:hypothetical protein
MVKKNNRLKYNKQQLELNSIMPGIIDSFLMLRVLLIQTEYDAFIINHHTHIKWKKVTSVGIMTALLISHFSQILTRLCHLLDGEDGSNNNSNSSNMAAAAKMTLAEEMTATMTMAAGTEEKDNNQLKTIS